VDLEALEFKVQADQLADDVVVVHDQDPRRCVGHGATLARRLVRRARRHVDRGGAGANGCRRRRAS
jgi:hypothetical protein